MAALPFDEEEWPTRSHTRSIIGEKGFTPLERLWERPALEVIAMASGDPVGVSRATIPSMASVDLSITRQKVGNVADELRDWVKLQISGRFDYQLTISQETAHEAYRTPEIPELDTLSQAMAKGFGVNEVGWMGNAGSGPADHLATSLGVPVLFFGTGLVENNWHDSDESVRVDLLTAGAATLAYLWSGLAAT